jgi:hypothetical protein
MSIIIIIIIIITIITSNFPSFGVSVLLLTQLLSDFFFYVVLFHITVRDSRTVDCIINFRDFDPVLKLCKERTSKVFYSML